MVSIARLFSLLQDSVLYCRTLAKVGVAAGAIAGTASVGIWSPDTHQSAVAVERIKAALPSTDQYLAKVDCPG